MSDEPKRLTRAERSAINVANWAKKNEVEAERRAGTQAERDQLRAEKEAARAAKTALAEHKARLRDDPKYKRLNDPHVLAMVALRNEREQDGRTDWTAQEFIDMQDANRASMRAQKPFAEQMADANAKLAAGRAEVEAREAAENEELRIVAEEARKQWA